MTELSAAPATLPDLDVVDAAQPDRTPPRTLYDIAGDLKLVEDALPDAGDEEAVDLLQAFFNQLSGELDDKLDGYCTVIREFESRSKARKEEAQRLALLAQIDARQAERMKGVLLWFFQTRDLKKKETLHFKLGRRANGGAAPLELLVLPEQLPDELRFVTVSAHTDAIRQALAEAEERFKELSLTRSMLHSISGLPPERLEQLTSLLRQLGRAEAQIREINSTAEAKGFDTMTPAEVERLARITTYRDDYAAQAEEIETFSSWTAENIEQLHAVEGELGGPPWCFAAFKPRGEHISIR